MQTIQAVEGIPIINSFGRESGPGSSKASGQPATPKLGQAPNWGGLGQPTPDTSPESIINATSCCKKTAGQTPNWGGPKQLAPNTPPESIVHAPIHSTEDITDAISTGHYSHYSTDSEDSGEAATASCADQEKSSSFLAQLRNSVINLFNLARQRDSRADNARVQNTIRLIKSLPTIRGTRIKNPTRTLTPSQYEQVLERIQEGKELPENLRFEYTHSTQQFEIRMPTPVHERLVAGLNERFIAWKIELVKSKNSIISGAVEALELHGNQDLLLPDSNGMENLKTPDGGITHVCKVACNQSPALLFEIAFSSSDEEKLRDKAKQYIENSNGNIRTVIVIYMREMHKAEMKNERRLKKMFRTSDPNESESQSYAHDERNITGEASIWVWRGTIQGNNQVKIGPVRKQIFRDSRGNAIQSALLRISLEDCVCKSNIASVRKSKVPLLEISSESLCNSIRRGLEQYRKVRAKKIRKQVQEDKEKKRLEEERERQREEERLRRAAGVGVLENVRVLGRIVEGQRRFSARIREGILLRGT
ncbi:hypothetical protein F4802DRAFT_555877 [Xylaria palmicola]|nr:hypothetical protein F4802DRAFT_555877 [Xylaria palmicola]